MKERKKTIITRVRRGLPWVMGKGSMIREGSQGLVPFHKLSGGN